jgi:hypothetical protein
MCGRVFLDGCTCACDFDCCYCHELRGKPAEETGGATNANLSQQQPWAISRTLVRDENRCERILLGCGSTAGVIHCFIPSVGLWRSARSCPAIFISSSRRGCCYMLLWVYHLTHQVRE